jgi:hypothetical protein
MYRHEHCHELLDSFVLLNRRRIVPSEVFLVPHVSRLLLDVIRHVSMPLPPQLLLGSRDIYFSFSTPISRAGLYIWYVDWVLRSSGTKFEPFAGLWRAITAVNRQLFPSILFPRAGA